MQGIGSFELVFFRSSVQWVIVLGFLAFFRISPLGPPEKRKLLCVRGGVGFVALSCFYFSITKMSLGDAVVLSFTSPVFTAIFAVFVLKEKWEKVDIFGAILSMGGVILIARPAVIFGGSTSDSGELGRLLAVGIAVFGAMMSGLAYVTVR
jgi:drug/metabolite transporter (DMT)-like permease